MKKKLWIGTSGYIYPHWRAGVFYPPKLPQSKWLKFYATKFNSVEINATFYKLAHREAVKRWYEQTPRDFRFILKGSRFITHMKQLNDPLPALRNFFRPLKPLRKKLTLVLWQFPERMKSKPDKLKAFIRVFRRMSPALLCFEFRNPEWFNDEIAGILEENHAAFCRADRPEFYKDLRVPDTAPFVYYRYHGPMLYAGAYSDADLLRDAKAMQTFLRKGSEVYAYFNNDIGGHAPRDAQRLLKFIES